MKTPMTLNARLDIAFTGCASKLFPTFSQSDSPRVMIKLSNTNETVVPRAAETGTTQVPTH